MDLAQVKSNIGKQFKLSGEKLEGLFSGKPVKIKSAVDVEAAGKYREVFRRAGGIIDIVPSGETPVAPVKKKVPPSSREPVTTAVDEAADLELMPANTGSLIDIAPPAPPAPRVDIEDFSLSPAGALFPEAESAAPANIDTSHLQAAEPNSGSLEEFAVNKEPVHIPDITHLQATSPGEGSLLDVVDEQPAPAPPDTSHLQAAPPNTGSLADCVEEKTPTQLPDISAIKLADQ